MSAPILLPPNGSTPGKKTVNVEQTCASCRKKYYAALGRCPFCPAPVTAAPALAISSWAVECAEWQDLGDEMNKGGRFATAIEVTMEQRRRMASRGERPMTYEEIVSEESSRATSPGLPSPASPDRSVG